MVLEKCFVLHLAENYVSMGDVKDWGCGGGFEILLAKVSIAHCGAESAKGNLVFGTTAYVYGQSRRELVGTYASGVAGLHVGRMVRRARAGWLGGPCRGALSSGYSRDWLGVWEMHEV